MNATNSMNSDRRSDMAAVSNQPWSHPASKGVIHAWHRGKQKNKSKRGKKENAWKYGFVNQMRCERIRYSYILIIIINAGADYLLLVIMCVVEFFCFCHYLHRLSPSPPPPTASALWPSSRTKQKIILFNWPQQNPLIWNNNKNQFTSTSLTMPFDFNTLTGPFVVKRCISFDSNSIDFRYLLCDCYLSA